MRGYSHSPSNVDQVQGSSTTSPAISVFYFPRVGMALKKVNHQNQSTITVQNIIKTYLTSLNGNLQFTVLKSDKLDCKLRTTEEAWKLYVGGQDLLVTLWRRLLLLPEHS